MRDDVFWAIRYTVLGVSLFLALLAIFIIIRYKLYERLMMVYVCLAAGCEGLMALSALLFNQNFIAHTSQTLNTNQPYLFLSQLQGFLFRAPELTSFTVTTAMTMIIYYSVNNLIDQFNRRRNLVMVLALVSPSVIALPMVFYEGNGPCCQGDICFNCACPNPQLPYWTYVINWMVPCVILTIITIVLIVKIERHRKKEIIDALRDQQRLALKAYYIPVLNFSFLILNIVLDSVGFLIGDDMPEVVVFMTLNLFVFLMPIFNLGAIRKYYTELQSLYETSSVATDSFSKKEPLAVGIGNSGQGTTLESGNPHNIEERLSASFRIES